MQLYVKKLGKILFPSFFTRRKFAWKVFKNGIWKMQYVKLGTLLLTPYFILKEWSITLEKLYGKQFWAGIDALLSGNLFQPWTVELPILVSAVDRENWRGLKGLVQVVNFRFCHDAQHQWDGILCSQSPRKTGTMLITFCEEINVFQPKMNGQLVHQSHLDIYIRVYIFKD